MSVNKVNLDGSLSRIAGSTLYADSPVGAILAYSGETAPIGWLVCNGSEVSKTTYSELYAVIGDAFGTASDNTKFKLPDLRGEFLRGAGTNSHTNQGNGGSVGEHQDATTVPYTYSNNSANNINFAGNGTTANLDSVPSVRNYYQTIDSSAHGTSSAYNFGTVRPTNTSVNYIIKAKQVTAPADFINAIDDVLSEFAKPISLQSLNNSSIMFDKSRIIGGMVIICASITVASGSYLTKENAIARIPNYGPANIGYILLCLYRNTTNGLEEPGFALIQPDGNLYPYYTNTEFNEIRINASYSSKN